MNLKNYHKNLQPASHKLFFWRPDYKSQGVWYQGMFIPVDADKNELFKTFCFWNALPLHIFHTDRWIEEYIKWLPDLQCNLLEKKSFGASLTHDYYLAAESN